MQYIFKQKNKIDTISSERGFTIVETLVAIFILLISITGPLSFAQSGLRASFLARDQITAFYLAQDAIETIKNIRDNNGLSQQDWLATIDDTANGCTDTNGCSMETAGTSVIIEACGSSCTPLYYDANEREFVLNSGSGRSVSKYTRKIHINEIEENQEAQIIVEVKWDSTFFSNRRVVVQENIYNWIPVYTP